MSSPSLSITTACSPEWAGLVQEYPALVAHRFSLALNSTLDKIIEKRPFGTVVTAVHAVDFCPPRLPRAHILLFVRKGPQIDTHTPHSGTYRPEWMLWRWPLPQHCALSHCSWALGSAVR